MIWRCCAATDSITVVTCSRTCMRLKRARTSSRVAGMSAEICEKAGATRHAMTATIRQHFNIQDPQKVPLQNMPTYYALLALRACEQKTGPQFQFFAGCLTRGVQPILGGRGTPTLLHGWRLANSI